MKKPVILIPLALLIVAALACGSGTTDDGGAPVLYRDSFSDSDSGWCVDSDATSSLDYASDEYLFEINDTEWFVWCNPDEDFTGIHVEVTARNVNNTPDTVFGVMCAYQADTDDFYYLGITSQGDYTIRRYEDGEDDILAEDVSDDITTEAASYQLGADCSGGRLVLYVDGVEIASAEDDTYSSGDIGLFAWTGDEVPAEIRYDDIVVTSLAADE